MTAELPFAYYINRGDRPDRRAHMERVLRLAGFKFERVTAFIPREIGNFHTPGALGNWISHQTLIEKIGKGGKPAIIFEDDIVITSVPRMKAAIDYMINARVEWVFLYFFGLRRRSPKIVDRVRTRELHGYLVNPKWARKISTMMKDRFAFLFDSGNRDASTYSGNYIGRVLQKHFPFYGMRPAIFQNRCSFGSDTGWMKLRPHER